METVQKLVAQQKALRIEIEARMDGVPNLREYGFERRAEFERDVEAYHQGTRDLEVQREDVAKRRMALVAAQRAERS